VKPWAKAHSHKPSLRSSLRAVKQVTARVTQSILVALLFSWHDLQWRNQELAMWGI